MTRTENGYTKPLPKVFENLTKIESIGRRNKILYYYFHIDRLIKDMQHIVIYETLGIQISRFFDYLKASCQDIKILNRRSRWIELYASIILFKIMREDKTFTSYSSSYTDPLIEKMRHLVDVIMSYLETRQLQKLSAYEHITNTVGVACDVVRLLSPLQLNESSHMFFEIDRDVDGILEQFTELEGSPKQVLGPSDVTLS